MSFKVNLEEANKTLTRLNKEELSLEESVKTYKVRLESIRRARLELEKAKLEVEKIDE